METESQKTEQTGSLAVPTGYAPTLLKLENVSGAGWQIHADITDRISFVEYAMKPGFKPILHGRRVLVMYEPWTGPFTPTAWDDMIAKTLGEMVDLWNAKYSVHNNEVSNSGA